MAKIDAFFKLMNEQGASDLHLVAGQPPALRIRGDIERIKFKVLESDDLRNMLYEISPEEKIKVFEETGDVDFGYEIPGRHSQGRRAVPDRSPQPYLGGHDHDHQSPRPVVGRQSPGPRGGNRRRAERYAFPRTGSPAHRVRRNSNRPPRSRNAI